MTKALLDTGVKVLRSVGKVLTTKDPLLWEEALIQPAEGLGTQDASCTGPPSVIFLYNRGISSKNRFGGS